MTERSGGRRGRPEAEAARPRCLMLDFGWGSEAEGWLGPVSRLGGSAGVGKVSRKGRGGRGEKGEPPMGEDGRGCFAG